ncbi:MAG: hypothetical protein JXR03_00280 [Cyclobacteriaceae bacterium]
MKKEFILRLIFFSTITISTLTPFLGWSQGRLINKLVNGFYSSKSQEAEWISTSLIYGKDGSILIGKQLGTKDEKIDFRLNTTDTIHVPMSYIQEIKGPDEVVIYPGGRYHYISKTFLFLSGGLGVNYEFSGQMNGAIGHRFAKKYAAGLGIGYESHTASVGGLFLQNDFMTLYGFGRYYINDRKSRLFADMKLGYGKPVNQFFTDNHSGGVVIQPGIGVVMAARKNLRWVYSISHTFQHTNGSTLEPDLFGNPIEAKYDIWYRRLMITIGMEIN